jgi:Putative zinc-finger
MNCHATGYLLPGYLDGAIDSREHARVREHLDSCERCREELERYRRMGVCLANVERAPAPSDLAARIRIQTSLVRPAEGTLGRIWSRAMLVFDHVVRPHAVPATGGILVALGIFVLLVQNILGGVPMGGVVPNDLPLNLIQPAALESLAPFPAPGIETADGQPASSALLVETTVNAQGQAVFYKILSGPNNSAVQRQVDEVLMFSRFRPQLSFGRPSDGGRVLLSFDKVRVRG